jgi:hypothetical protein
MASNALWKYFLAFPYGTRPATIPFPSNNDKNSLFESGLSKKVNLCTNRG